MSIRFLAFSPEIILLLGLVIMMLTARFRTVQNTPKTFFTLSRFTLLAALLAAVVFYDRSSLPAYFVNNSYTVLFKGLVYLLGMSWFFLSCKWFLNKNLPTFRYYALGLTAILLFSLLISAQNLLIVWLLFLGSALVNFFLIRLNPEEEELAAVQAGRYLAFAFGAAVLMAGALAVFYVHFSGWNYSHLYHQLARPENLTNLNLWACGLFLCGLLFALAIAPFHFWLPDVIRTAVLPVSGYLMLIPVVAFVGCFVNLMLNVFFPVGAALYDWLNLLAFATLFIGAVAANQEGNIRVLFAYTALYNLAVVLIGILNFTEDGTLSGFVYMLIYTLAYIGIYTVFLGCKSNGDYVSALRDLSGISHTKPGLSAALLIFMVSMIGSPPLLGFLGKLSVVNNLLIEGRYVTAAAILLGVISVANAYLQVVRTIYFEPSVKSFDRIDRSIYLSLFVNLVLVVILILNPGGLIRDFETLLSSVF